MHPLTSQWASVLKHSPDGEIIDPVHYLCKQKQFVTVNLLKPASDWSVKTISRFDSSAKFLFSRCHGNENFRIQLIIFYNLIIIQV